MTVRAVIDNVLDQLRTLVHVEDWAQAADAEVLESLQGLETAARLVSAAAISLTAQADRRGLSVSRAYISVGALLRHSLGIAPGEANLREQLAKSLCGTVLPSGELAPPQLPATAAALRDGATSVPHARIIQQTITDLPARLESSIVAKAEEFLADQACQLNPAELRKAARHLRATLDQDGLLQAERDAVADRELTYIRDHRGRLLIRGRLDAEAGAAFQAAIQSLAAPAPAVDGQRDPRSASRRRADALVALVERSLALGDLPTDAGERPQVTVTIDFDSLVRDVGSATLGHGEVVTAASARRIACDARIVPVVLGTRSEPLDVGRASYVVPQPMRRALVVRDEGCAFPGCGRPPGWTDAHHIEHWADGGETRVDNLVLLCGRHHRVVHHDDWHVAIVDGRPEFVPPYWIDPERKPRHRKRSPEFTTTGRPT